MFACEDITNGQETLKIPVINSLDDEKPDSFEYIRSNIPSQDCSMEDFNVQYAPCCCSGGEIVCCNNSTCFCIDNKSSGASYDSESRLLLDVMEKLQHGKPIYECNTFCKCKVPRCSNRVVQRGIRCKLYITKTSTRGWALKTLEPLARGTFVCEYAGEVLTYEEAQDRSRSQKSAGKNYLMVLQENLAAGGVIRTYVDPWHVGNVGRFINHSCNPNLTMTSVRVDNDVPHLALFAKRDVESDEELCFNYAGDGSKGSGNELGTKQCLCGSANCVKYMPFDGSLFPS